MFIKDIEDRLDLCLKSKDRSEKIYLLNLKDFNTDIDFIEKCLLEKEILRKNKIINKEKRNLFILRKGILRIVLNENMSCDIRKIKYRYTNHGKPVLDNLESDINFNISHSKEFLLIGISSKGEIGVDIERISNRSSSSLFNIVDSLYSPSEKITFNKFSREDQVKSIYKTWVQKEAISKLIGSGLSMDFSRLDVNIDPKRYGEYDLFFKDIKCSIKILVHETSRYVYAVAFFKN